MLLAIAGLWAFLTLTFIWRLRTIMANLSNLIRPGRGWFRVPDFDVRPLKHLAAWKAELVLLIVWYDLFGVSIVAHLAATFSAVGLMILLRDRTESNWFKSLQILALSENVA
jgi:hypothetical protein